MTTITFPYNQTGIVSVGLYDSGSAWGGGGTGGNHIGQISPILADFLITGATAVGSGGYYITGSTGITYTLKDTSGNVLATSTPTTTSPAMTTGGYQNASVNLFPGYTMSASSTYWVSINNTYAGGALFQCNNFIQLTGPTSPTILTTLPTGYGPTYVFGSGVGSTNILPNVGLEGGMTATTQANFPVLKPTTAGGTVCEYGMVRFKATVSSLYVLLYPTGASNLHLNRLPDNGTSGVGTPSGDVVAPASGYTWQQFSGTLDSSNEYIYEISAGGNGGTIIYGIMAGGGSGVNTTVTGSTLVRPLLLAVIGDSRAAQVNGTGGQGGNVLGNPYVGSLALLGQNTNKQILNTGIPGNCVAAAGGAGTVMISRTADITGYGTNPSAVLIDGGINDIKGKRPIFATFSGALDFWIMKASQIGGAFHDCQRSLGPRVA